MERKRRTQKELLKAKEEALVSQEAKIKKIKAEISALKRKNRQFERKERTRLLIRLGEVFSVWLEKSQGVAWDGEFFIYEGKKMTPGEFLALVEVYKWKCTND